MKKLLFLLAFCATFFNLCAAQNAIDTVGSSFVYFNRQQGIERIMPREAVQVAVNTIQNTVTVYTTANQSIFSGRLTTLQVPNCETSEQKITWIKSVIGSSSSSSGSAAAYNTTTGAVNTRQIKIGAGSTASNCTMTLIEPSSLYSPTNNNYKVESVFSYIAQ